MKLESFGFRTKVGDIIFKSLKLCQKIVLNEEMKNSLKFVCHRIYLHQIVTLMVYFILLLLLEVYFVVYY